MTTAPRDEVVEIHRTTTEELIAGMLEFVGGRSFVPYPGGLIWWPSHRWAMRALGYRRGTHRMVSGGSGGWYSPAAVLEDSRSGTNYIDVEREDDARAAMEWDAEAGKARGETA